MIDADLRRALRFIVPYWRRLVLVLAISLISTGLSLWLPLLSRDFFDRALLGRDASSLIRVAVLFAVITISSFVLNVVSGLRYTRVSADILFDMRLEMYRHLQRLSPRFFARTRMGDVALAHQQRRRRNPADRGGNRAGVGRERAVPRGHDRHARVARLAPVPADDRGRARQPVGARSLSPAARRRSLRPPPAQLRHRQLPDRNAARRPARRHLERAGARDRAIRGSQPRLRRRADVDAEADVSLGRPARICCSRPDPARCSSTAASG